MDGWMYMDRQEPGTEVKTEKQTDTETGVAINVPSQLKHVLAGNTISKLIICGKIEAIQEVPFSIKCLAQLTIFIKT